MLLVGQQLGRTLGDPVDDGVLDADLKVATTGFDQTLDVLLVLEEDLYFIHSLLTDCEYDIEEGSVVLVADAFDGGNLRHLLVAGVEGLEDFEDVLDVLGRDERLSVNTE